MPYFKWKGKTIDGRMTKGEIIATDKNEAIAKLKLKKISVITVTPASKEIRLSKKVKLKNLAVVTRQIGEMLKSGLPADDSLRIAAEQTKSKLLGETLYSVRDKVREGNTLSSALSQYPTIFSKTYIGLIKSSEQTGNLDEAFLHLAEMLEKRLDLRRKVVGALIYPSVIAIVAVAVIAVIMTVAIPMFSKMYIENGMKLPALTEMVISISMWLKSSLVFIVTGVVLILIFLRVMYKKSERVKYAIDRLIISAPILGNIQRKLSLANFAVVLSTLLNSGVGILDALESASNAVSNAVIKRSVTKVEDYVRDGESLSTAMNVVGEFTDMVVQMVYVGEESGKIGDMLKKVSEYYEKDVDNVLKNLTNMIEPAIILFMGSTVGFLVVSMYLPIFKIGQTIK